MYKNVIAVLDGAAGSCGKAKVISELALDNYNDILASVSTCSPNAGHTVVLPNEKKYIFRNIPVACVNPNVALFISPGSLIDMDVFKKEYESVKHLIGERKIYVHELVPIIEERHKQRERQTIKSGSTYHGGGAALQDKIIRNPELNFFKGYKNAITLKNDDWLNMLYSYLESPNGYVILEGGQGADLSLEFSGNYPYVTKENISTSNLLNHTGVPLSKLLDTIMVIRPFPIRINNNNETGKRIYTGGYGNGAKLSWSRLNISAMNGTYPFIGDIELKYDSTLIDINYLKNLIAEAISDEKPYIEEELFEILNGPYQQFDFKNLTIEQALEIERKIISEGYGMPYYSKIINEHLIELAETTTVTKRERKIFDLDIKKLKNNIRINEPKTIYLNFFEQLNLEYEDEVGKWDDYYFDFYLNNYLEWLESEAQEVLKNSPSNIVEIAALGTGATTGSNIKKRELILK